MAINIRTDKNHRSSASCTFCQGSHTITGCPTIVQQAEEGKKLLFSQRTYKQHYAMQYIELKANRSVKRKISDTRKCGYCSGTGHTRRNCSVMTEDRELLTKANRVWRTIYAIKSVELGFAPASLIKYKESKGYNYNSGNYDYEDKMYLIGSELPSNLSVFAIAKDYNLRQQIKIPAVGRNSPLGLRDMLSGNPVESALAGSGYYYGKGEQRLVLVTKSTYEYPQEWINGECEDVDFVLKKWDKNRITRDILSPIRENLIPIARQMGLWD